MAARGALRDTGRALGMEYQKVDTIASWSPTRWNHASKSAGRLRGFQKSL
jgi:DNA polymerase III alpha subunit